MRDNIIQKSIVTTKSEANVLEAHGYKISLTLGQGGFSQVYLTEYSKNQYNIKLACKVIDTKSTNGRIIRKFLPQELKIISYINHPHIVSIHSIFQYEAKFYIFMRLAESGDLLDYIMDYGPVESKLAKYWTRQLVLAIQYLHVLHIAHRDIKCENILVTHKCNIKLTDFGFARFCIDDNNNDILSETYCGSLSYASPQILLCEPYDPRANDMWSFGCVIYTMLNKATPFFKKTNIIELHKAQMTKKYKFRSKYSYNYTQDAVDLVCKLLEPNQLLRYKIKDVLNSKWFVTDLAFNTLNKQEYIALSKAQAQARLPIVSAKRSEINNQFNFTNPPMYIYKESNEAYNLNLINSESNAAKRLSSLS